MDIKERFLTYQNQLKILKQDHQEVETLKEFLDSFDRDIYSLSDLNLVLQQLKEDISLQIRRVKFSMKHEADTNTKKLQKRIGLLRKQLILMKYYGQFYPLIEEIDKISVEDLEDWIGNMKLNTDDTMENTTLAAVQNYFVVCFLIAKYLNHLEKAQNNVEIIQNLQS